MCALSSSRMPLLIFYRVQGGEDLKLQGNFRKRATNYRALLQKLTHEDKASYGSEPPCTSYTYDKVYLLQSILFHMTKYTSYLTSQKRPISKLHRNPKEPNTHPKRDLKHAPQSIRQSIPLTKYSLSYDKVYRILCHRTKYTSYGILCHMTKYTSYKVYFVI